MSALLLPVKYAWLAKEPGPKMIIEFIKTLGIKEEPGTADNPLILQWAHELGLKDYTHDSIAWCGLEMAIIAKRAGKNVPRQPLWALNWLKFGHRVHEPMLGDVLVFRRTGGGHVGLYIAEDATTFHVGGGNQSDMSGFTRIDKSRLVEARRPDYNVQPANVRRIFLSADGSISTNEA